MRAGTAEIVDVGEVLLQAFRLEVEEVHLVERAARSAFRAGTVVAHHQHDCVVELAEALEVVDDTADLRVGVLEEPGIYLHHAGVQPLLVGAERVPGLDPVRPLRTVRAFGQETRRDLPSEDLVAPSIPSVVEATAVLLDVLAWCLVRRVASTGREVEEERPVGRGCAQIVDIRDRVVGEVLGEVVARLRRAWWIDLVVVVHEIRVVLVGLARHEAIETIEAAAERPPLLRRARRHLRRRRQVPFPDREGCVTRFA